MKCKCPKWPRMSHLDVCSPSYGQMKGRESNCHFERKRLPTIKSRESTRFTWLQATCDISLESSRLGLQLTLDLIAIGGLHKKLCALKVAKVPAGGISGLSRGSPGTKSHLGVAPVESHKVYYKGEGDGFPQVRAVVSLVCPCCPWLVLAPKVLQLCTNHFVWVVYMPV